MTIMRATFSLLSLLVLSGCAAGMRQPHEIMLRPRPKIVQINGTVEPVAFVAKHTRIAAARGSREPCQTNDPMPTGQFEEPAPRMLYVRPLHVAPMPNYCPVTVPLTSTSVVTSGPRPLKSDPAPVPAQPQP